MINLNEGFDSNGIFNDGSVGIVEDVLFSKIEVHLKDNVANGYKLTFSKGGDLFQFINYYNENNDSNGNISKAIGMTLKNLIVAFYGESYSLQSFPTMLAAIDGVAKLLKAKIGSKCAVHVCYGTLDNPSTYMRFHKYSPWISSPSKVNILKLSNKNLYIRPNATPSLDITPNVYTSTNTNMNPFDNTAEMPTAENSDDLPF